MKRTSLLLVSSLVLGLFSFAVQHWASRPQQLQAAVQGFQKVEIAFELLDEPKKFSQSHNYSSTIKIFSATPGGQQIRLSAKGLLLGDSQLRDLQRGARYGCLMSLSPTAAGERAGFKGRCNDSPIQIVAAAKKNSLVTGLRAAFMKNLRGVDTNSAGLVAGLAIGDVSMLSQSLLDQMKLVSLTHLTAVSGANCAIVLAMFYLLVRKLGGGRWWRLGVGLAALIGYVQMVGAQPSVLRAAVMAASVLIGVSLGRKTAPMSALALSVIVLLIADPWLSIDFGFALSVAATAGLLVLTQPITARLQRHLPGWLAIAVAVSLSAQILCLPILLQLQSGIATYALPANVLAEPLVAPVTVLGICACLIAWLFPPAAWCLTYLASEATWLIAQIANYFASQQNVTLGWPTGVAGAALAISLVIAFLLWFKAEPTRLRNLGLTTLALIAAFSVGSIGFNLVQSANWPLRDWQVVACDVGQGDALVIRSAGKIALVDVGRENRPVNQCLQRLDVKRIDLLVLTHFDMDHIGGLSGAIAGRQVGIALVSPFKDERWGATGTNLTLANAGIKILAVERGVTGNLGECQWQVLNPNRNAAGAENSNDASIAMLWQTAEFNLLTMADLGEKGQRRIASQDRWWQDPALQTKPLILKVSHHGSADQFGELIQTLMPDISLISVGQNNSYGHPTLKTLEILQGTGSKIERTDELGSIAVASRGGGLVTANAPGG
ncbi:MAG: DNA internalization-related competence protein ComEC/Rec2 [Actinobacteria bacterium]|nr:DNA internalization-related competence protein ComEC/Rec2 [Actinomycetota bacterium]